MPKISVLIPTYNRAGYLKESLGSVLSQECVDFEVIVSDNASTDNTKEVVESFADPRIRYFRNKENLGPMANGLNCYKMATGEYLAWLLDDDVMLPGMMDKKTELLDANHSVGLVHSHYVFVDPFGNPLKFTGTPIYPNDRIFGPGEFFKDLINSNNLVAFSTIMMRRECYDKLGFHNFSIGYTNDFEMWMRIALHYGVAYMAKPTIKYRIHPGQDTNNFANKPHGVEQLFEAKRLMLDTYPQLIENHKELKSAIALLHARQAVELGSKFAWSGNFSDACKCFGLALRLHPSPGIILRIPGALLLGPKFTQFLRRLKHKVCGKH
jgi:glycosyltransferase involved in cell wall biosynthesis